MLNCKMFTPMAQCWQMSHHNTGANDVFKVLCVPENYDFSEKTHFVNIKLWTDVAPKSKYI